MQWITSEQVRVGRTGCAWLIERFVDPQAEFLFVPGAQGLSEASRLGATPFHVEGAELAARGDQSSFEVVMAKYGLTNDPALALLGKIVNTADVKGSQAQRPEGPGLKAITEGFLALFPTDAARIEAGGAVFDALYAYCQQMVARGAA
jgi:hypothetical protein